jgi:glutamate-1-semialdehyde 2,1-aminomutase
VIRIYKTEPVIETLWERGRALQSGIQKAIEEEKLTQYFQVLGKPCCLIYSTLDDERRPSQSFRTLFLQETIKRGIIAPSFVISYSHSETDVRRTVEAVHDALVVYRKALQEGISKYLEGRPVKPVFRCFN